MKDQPNQSKKPRRGRKVLIAACAAVVAVGIARIAWTPEGTRFLVDRGSR